MSDRAANVVLGVVLTVWAVNVLAAIVSFRGYEGSESLNGLVTTAVGAAFVYRAAKAKNEADDDRPRRKRPRRDDDDQGVKS